MGRPHGEGTLKWPSGAVYVGEYRDGQRDSRGRFTWPGLQGRMTGGLRHGSGVGGRDRARQAGPELHVALRRPRPTHLRSGIGAGGQARTTVKGIPSPSWGESTGEETGTGEQEAPRVTAQPSGRNDCLGQRTHGGACAASRSSNDPVRRQRQPDRPCTLSGTGVEGEQRPRRLPYRAHIESDDARVRAFHDDNPLGANARARCHAGPTGSTTVCPIPRVSSTLGAGDYSCSGDGPSPPHQPPGADAALGRCAGPRNPAPAPDSTTTARLLPRPCFAIRAGERPSGRLYAPPQGQSSPRLNVIASKGQTSWCRLGGLMTGRSSSERAVVRWSDTVAAQ